MVVLIMFVITPIAMLFNGMVFCILWGWFIVPTFELPALSVLEAVGISVVWSALAVGVNRQQIKDLLNDDPDESKVGIVKLVVDGFVYPVIYLVIGFIVHVCM